MQNAPGIQGYEFTAEQHQQFQASVDRITSTLGVTIRPVFGSASGFAGVTVALVDDALRAHGKLLHLQSARDRGGMLWFGVMDSKGQPVGGQDDYQAFSQALAVAEGFALGIIRELQARRTPPDPVSAPAMTAPSPASSESSDGSFRGNILTPQEVGVVNAFAQGLGNCSRTQGFAKYMEARIGVLSIALGVLDDKDRPLLLGTVVVVTDDTGGYECSVRDVNNSPLQGPATYPRIASALTNALPYLEFMATDVGKQIRPTLMARLRANLGL